MVLQCIGFNLNSVAYHLGVQRCKFGVWFFLGIVHNLSLSMHRDAGLLCFLEKGFIEQFDSSGF